MMLTPGIVGALDVGRRVEIDRVVVRVALDDIVAGAIPELTVDGEADVALAAGEGLLLAAQFIPERPILEGLIEFFAFEQIPIQRRVGDVLNLVCSEGHGGNPEGLARAPPRVLKSG